MIGSLPQYLQPTHGVALGLQEHWDLEQNLQQNEPNFE